MGRKPFRARVPGKVIAFLAVAIPCLATVAWWNDHMSGSATMLFWIAGAPTLVVGARLQRHEDRLLLANDTRRPVLYLRPFHVDDDPSPAYGTFNDLYLLIYAVGGAVLFIVLALALLEADEFSKSHPGPTAKLFESLVVVGFGGLSLVVFVGFPIVTVYRWALGRNKTTLELDLAYCFRDRGPFVAVGQPREWFAPPGAARMYLEDDEWQDTVVKLMQRASFVVLCPSPEGWTWWEVQQVYQLCEPHRVLFAFPLKYNSHQKRQLAARLQNDLGITVPDDFDERSFLRFDTDWTAIPVKLKFRPWILRPLLVHRLSRQTFETFFSGISDATAVPQAKI